MLCETVRLVSPSQERSSHNPFRLTGDFLNMRLEGFLDQKKTLVLKKWFEQVAQTYPADTSKFLNSQKDPFANPVGGTFKRGLEALFDELLQGWNAEAVRTCLDPMIRIRAIQDFTPARAVSFIFSLKHILRNALKKELKGDRLVDELFLFETRIDETAMLAFNIYMECREKIYELKATEIHNRTFRAFERAGLVSAISEEGPGR